MVIRTEMRARGLLKRTALLAATVAAIAALGGSAGAQDTIRIGSLNDQTGPFADTSGPGWVDAAKMAIEDFGGTVLGKKIELLSVDDRNNADHSLATVRGWLDNEGVKAILSGSNSPITLATVGLAKDRATPFMIAGAGISSLTGTACTAYSIQYAWDTYAMPRAAVEETMRKGAKSWFLITWNTGFGNVIEADVKKFVESGGGKFVGSVKHPLNNADFSSYLLQAQASKAEVIAFGNPGADFVNAMKQAKEFGLTKGGQKLVSLTESISFFQALGPDATQGLLLSTPFYWDRDDESRAWSKRYMDRNRGRAPNLLQSGAYSAVTHYLNAVKAAGTTDGKVVAAKMRELPINDFQMKNVKVRADGQAMRDYYLFEVKTPAESKGQYDLYKQIGTVPASQVWKAESDSECPLLKK